MKVYRPNLIKILLIALVLIICLGMLEFLLRSFVFDPNASYIRTPGQKILVRTNGLLPKSKIPDDHTITINRLGIRGAMPAFEHSIKIAVLGGSTVEDWLLSEGDTWAQQLAMNLEIDCEPKVYVANLGKSGVNARHHLLQLPEVQKYMPKFDIYVVLMGLNDFLYDLHIHHPVKTPEGWWKQQAFQFRQGDEGSFALIAILNRLKRQYSGDVTPELKKTSDSGNYMKRLWDANAKVTSNQRLAALPDLKKHLWRYEITIRELKGYADSLGVPIIFLTQPFVWSDRMSEEAKAQLYAGYLGTDLDSKTTKWYTPDAMQKGLSAYNETLLAICEKEGLTCFDAFPHIRDASLFYDDFHFSKQGAAKLGYTVAQAIRPRIVGCQFNTP